MAKRRDCSDNAVGGVLRVKGILVEILHGMLAVAPGYPRSEARGGRDNLDGTVDTADVRTIDTPS